LAIEGHKRKLLEAHLEKLAQLYLAAPYNSGHEPGIRISLGEADIVVPIQEDYFNTAGVLSSTICFKAMNDAAIFAVSSLVVNSVALTMNFSISLTQTPASGDLLARGRFVGISGDQYLAESILTDSNGEEIGRGEGALEVRDVPSLAAAG
jgi:acyl-coenzyme A thioesterase PaaI-like protein